MKRDKVLAWLRRHAGQRVHFSDLSRVLISNNKTQRARSHAARAELRSILLDLQREGVVVLRNIHPKRPWLEVEVLAVISGWAHEHR